MQNKIQTWVNLKALSQSNSSKPEVLEDEVVKEASKLKNAALFLSERLFFSNQNLEQVSSEIDKNQALLANINKKLPNFKSSWKIF